ncbi:NAD-dependent epimerase/dehydratase family protein [Photobacterium galatheae]|uniref:NAD-dependent epimerase/dehydratase family protein n=1 Tax=Photobacterium galatheae TaxID=1654360 RepID=UPI00202CE72F|nr:NAD-dependent epimerase/dehydratase family protein [Photobacterium galatheae]MCM0147219.1 NAD-dependent epimerase/dehydratase family protein [Photobacterium galatheae]
METKTRISICGCGWLGLPLAKSLSQAGYVVTGTKQSEGGIRTLQQEGIHAVALQLPLAADDIAPLQDFLSADLLIVNVPPGRRQMTAASYIEKIMSLSQAAKQAGCKQMIFISTTSVYGDVEGEVTESTTPEPTTVSGQAHVHLEQTLRDVWGPDLVVLRLAGLIGPQRHPVKYLAGGKGVANGSAPVNLVHLDDVMAAVAAMLKHWPTMTTLHLSAPQHPSREQYYCEMARLAGLPVPEFLQEGENGKWINADRTARELGLNWRHGDLLSLAPEY